MIEDCIKNLDETRALIRKISPELYKKPLALFGGSSIGQHIRHLLEFYQCLLSGIESGIVDYDARVRSMDMEVNPDYTVNIIEEIKSNLKKANNKALVLHGIYADKSNGSTGVNTTIERELLFCLEHSIHHQASIKMGLRELKQDHLIGTNFGISPSTQEYRKRCAQ